MQSAYLEELDRLNETLADIERQLHKLQAMPRYYGNDYTEQALESVREAGRTNLSRAADEPYFGRLDFMESQSSGQAMPLYIGKIGVEHSDSGVPQVIDWRAPIASLYYSFTGGSQPASYESPDGYIEGLIYLKRNIVIRKKILQRVVDSYVRGEENTGVADEFLLYRLGENKDNRLRDIVSTIQAEQDRIIRSGRNIALFIQGVAGSGKTTVALHRLAFLLYQYRENIRSERMIIFAPNRMFLDYISGVLPELGVGNIQQTTFADWALARLSNEVKLADPAIMYDYWFAVGPDRPEPDDWAPGRYKGSIRFKQMLDECLDRLEDNFLPHADYVPWEGQTLRIATIRQWFYEELQHYPLLKRRERTIARLKRWLDMLLKEVRDDGRRKELKKKAEQKLRTYLKAWPLQTPFGFYRQVLIPSDRPAWLTVQSLQELPDEIVHTASKEFRKKTVRMEDLAPLLHIYNRLNGIEADDRFDHVVIDEAQDFSPFQVALLQQHVSTGSFTILGDLSQGIHAYQGIHNWKEMMDLFDHGQAAFHKLEQSYRSTMEIIQFANAVLRNGGITGSQAVPVFRSGAPVQVMKTDTNHRFEKARDIVRELLSQNRADSIAVISRSRKAAEQLHAFLLQDGLDASLIGAGQQQYKGGLSVLPVYLAKGLEFDAVVLVDVEIEQYRATEWDAKLLYVACTRALHTLCVLYEEVPSPLIDGILAGAADGK